MRDKISERNEPMQFLPDILLPTVNQLINFSKKIMTHGKILFLIASTVGIISFSQNVYAGCDGTAPAPGCMCVEGSWDCSTTCSGTMPAPGCTCVEGDWNCPDTECENGTQNDEGCTCVNYHWNCPIPTPTPTPLSPEIGCLWNYKYYLCSDSGVNLYPISSEDMEGLVACLDQSLNMATYNILITEAVIGNFCKYVEGDYLFPLSANPASVQKDLNILQDQNRSQAPYAVGIAATLGGINIEDFMANDQDTTLLGSNWRKFSHFIGVGDTGKNEGSEYAHGDNYQNRLIEAYRCLFAEVPEGEDCATYMAPPAEETPANQLSIAPLALYGPQYLPLAKLALDGLYTNSLNSPRLYYLYDEEDDGNYTEFSTRASLLETTLSQIQEEFDSMTFSCRAYPGGNWDACDSFSNMIFGVSALFQTPVDGYQYGYLDRYNTATSPEKPESFSTALGQMGRSAFTILDTINAMIENDPAIEETSDVETADKVCSAEGYSIPGSLIDVAETLQSYESSCYMIDMDPTSDRYGQYIAVSCNWATLNHDEDPNNDTTGLVVVPNQIRYWIDSFFCAPNSERVDDREQMIKLAYGIDTQQVKDDLQDQMAIWKGQLEEAMGIDLSAYSVDPYVDSYLDKNFACGERYENNTYYELLRQELYNTVLNQKLNPNFTADNFMAKALQEGLFTGDNLVAAFAKLNETASHNNQSHICNLNNALGSYIDNDCDGVFNIAKGDEDTTVTSPDPLPDCFLDLCDDNGQNCTCGDYKDTACVDTDLQGNIIRDYSVNNAVYQILFSESPLPVQVRNGTTLTVATVYQLLKSLIDTQNSYGEKLYTYKDFKEFLEGSDDGKLVGFFEAKILNNCSIAGMIPDSLCKPFVEWNSSTNSYTQNYTDLYRQDFRAFLEDVSINEKLYQPFVEILKTAFNTLTIAYTNNYQDQSYTTEVHSGKTYYYINQDGAAYKDDKAYICQLAKMYDVVNRMPSSPVPSPELGMEKTVIAYGTTSEGQNTLRKLADVISVLYPTADGKPSSDFSNVINGLRVLLSTVVVSQSDGSVATINPLRTYFPLLYRLSRPIWPNKTTYLDHIMKQWSRTLTNCSDHFTEAVSRFLKMQDDPDNVVNTYKYVLKAATFTPGECKTACETTCAETVPYQCSSSTSDTVCSVCATECPPSGNDGGGYQDGEGGETPPPSPDNCEIIRQQACADCANAPAIYETCTGTYNQDIQSCEDSCTKQCNEASEKASQEPVEDPVIDVCDEASTGYDAYECLRRSTLPKYLSKPGYLFNLVNILKDPGFTHYLFVDRDENTGAETTSVFRWVIYRLNHSRLIDFATESLKQVFDTYVYPFYCRFEDVNCEVTADSTAPTAAKAMTLINGTQVEKSSDSLRSPRRLARPRPVFPPPRRVTPTVPQIDFSKLTSANGEVPPPLPTPMPTGVVPPVEGVVPPPLPTPMPTGVVPPVEGAVPPPLPTAPLPPPLPGEPLPPPPLPTPVPGEVPPPTEASASSVQ